MLAPVTHILPLTTIHRERLLPIPGRVVVRAGQKVSATDVIAEARLVTRHMLLDIARGLGVSSEEADEHIGRKAGDQVAKGDVIAGPLGVFNRTVRAPNDARIVSIGAGQALLELESDPFILHAGIPGTVLELVPDRGAIIETYGALVQGVWGNNQIDKSLLSVVATNPEDELTPEQLDVSRRGAVVLGGYCPNGDVLRAAANLPLRGLILSSMPSNLIAQASDISFPIVVIEGFGKLPMNHLAFNLLATNANREVTVNASAWNADTGDRPEAIIPLPVDNPVSAPRESDIFAPGQVVRIVRPPNAASAGTLVSIRPGLTAFPSGIRAAAGVVRLSSEEQVVIPLANLDVIE